MSKARRSLPSIPASSMRALLERAAFPVAGAPPERQGAGALDAGRALANAIAWSQGAFPAPVMSPERVGDMTRVVLQDLRARSVHLLGSWDRWDRPGRRADRVSPGVWGASTGPLPAGRYAYKLVVDHTLWLADPANPEREHDGVGGWNSVLVVP
jgi:hypothetical protein